MVNAEEFTRILSYWHIHLTVFVFCITKWFGKCKNQEKKNHNPGNACQAGFTRVPTGALRCNYLTNRAFQLGILERSLLYLKSERSEKREWRARKTLLRTRWPPPASGRIASKGQGWRPRDEEYERLLSREAPTVGSCLAIRITDQITHSSYRHTW